MVFFVSHSLEHCDIIIVIIIVYDRQPSFAGYDPDAIARGLFLRK